jgi:DNA-binding LacI/PurR family transcriptional regulator
MTEKVRISDIASQCGVSISTVSLVLNDKPGVSEQTRARVLAASRQLGYTLPSPNQANPDSRLKTIGMIVKTDTDTTPQANPFYSKVILGIEDVCRRSGINLLFATLPTDENNRPVEIPKLFFNPDLDGILMVGTFLDETILSIRSKHTPPIVLVDGYSNTESYDAVVSDNFKAAYQAVESLIQKGHRFIGLVGSDQQCYPSLKERRNGYLRALKEHGIGEVYISNFNINRTDGYRETTTLLQDFPHLSALFCINDNVASAALRAAKDLGKRVPAELSVIGYDDTYISANTHPALTTMHVDTLAMGRAAVRLLALRVDNPESARMTLIIHTWMIERESVSSA